MVTGLGEGKCWIQICCTLHKSWPSILLMAEGLGKYIYLDSILQLSNFVHLIYAQASFKVLISAQLTKLSNIEPVHLRIVAIISYPSARLNKA